MQAYTRSLGHLPEWGVLRVSTLRVGSAKGHLGRTSVGMHTKLQPSTVVSSVSYEGGPSKFEANRGLFLQI
jgi:hypothetical protein